MIIMMQDLDFTNNIIAPENLPELQTEDFNPVDKKYLRLIYIRLAITSLIFAAMITGLFFLSGEEFPILAAWIFGGFILAIMIYSFIITTLSFPYRGYLIREKDIAYQRGLISYKLTTIPYKRIQHVELNQGVLAKKMNLASIKVFTAGGSGDDLSIPGLTMETAKEVRAYLTEIISADE